MTTIALKKEDPVRHNCKKGQKVNPKVCKEITNNKRQTSVELMVCCGETVKPPAHPKYNVVLKIVSPLTDFYKNYVVAFFISHPPHPSHRTKCTILESE